MNAHNVNRSIKYVYIKSNVTDTEAFAKSVMIILNSRKGWGQLFVWNRVKAPTNNSYEIYLQTNDDIVKEHGKSFDKLSCARVGGPQCWINYENWSNPPEKSGYSKKCQNVSEFMTCACYKYYVINHEVGHVLGLEHPTEKHLKTLQSLRDNLKHQINSPIMVQQTKGTHLKFNLTTHPYPSEYEIQMVKKIHKLN